MDEMSRGAEASVYETEYMGRGAILKVRSPKRYRHPDLDERLRVTRTKNEARVMRGARAAGVRTPMIYDIDTHTSSIVMERMAGRSVKDILDSRENIGHVCSLIGETIAKLHNRGISHGDLTTSNMILTGDGKICLIDFSLGNTAAEAEDMGVDIHLLKRAFMSAHSSIGDSFDTVIGSYMIHMSDAQSIMKKAKEIENRGRYT